MRHQSINICFYNFELKEAPVKFMINIVGLIENYFNFKPSGISYTGKNKVIKYQNEQILKLQNKDNISDIVIFFGGELAVNNDWSIYVGYNRATLSLIFDFKLIENIDKMLELFIPYVKNFDFSFIKGFSAKEYPEYYNMGIIGGEWSTREEEKIWSWSLHYPHYEIGNLRDVYPYNIISDLHLNRDVHGQTLESWIKSDPSHGTLEKISDTHWLWTVEDQHIPKAQEVLSSAHLLVAYWEKY